MATAISIDRTSLAALCRRHHIRRLSLLGSVLRPDFRPESDVDVLVEFDPGHVPGCLALHEIETDLSRLLGGTTWTTTRSSTPGEIARGRGIELEEALALEFPLIQHLLAGEDFYEGVRSVVVVDKDRKPRWSFPTLADVSEAAVDRHFAALGELELRFS